jgi:hypothetical protein
LGNRCGLDVLCSISQNIQTKAAPRQITTIKNSSVNAGAVSMFNILDQMQTAYQQTKSTTPSVMKTPRSRYSCRRDLALEVLDAFGVRSSQIPDEV